MGNSLMQLVGRSKEYSIAMPHLINIVLFAYLSFSLAFVSHSISEILDVSTEEYLRMKTYLAVVNKPPMKIMTTDAGDIFDCVDLYKQPSLDHPSLQNHTVQIIPSSFPPLKKLKSSSYTDMDHKEVDEEGCPPGTVPIKRVYMEDLLKFGSIQNYNSKYGRSGYEAPYSYSSKHKHVGRGIGTGTFYGTQVTMNVWKPKIDVTRKQIFSLAQLWFVQYHPSNTIEVGWHVYPAFHRGSNDTRLFIYTNVNNYGPGSCYNSGCGFVQVDNKITPGMALKASTYGGTQEEITISVYKNDDQTGNWWLGYEDSNGYVSVGYWPNSIFTSLAHGGAAKVDWGGETCSHVDYNNPAITGYAPMGSGHFPSEGYQKAAYMSNMKIKLERTNKMFVDVPNHIYGYTTAPQCYGIGNQTTDECTTLGPHFFFGGPGGCTC